MSSVQVCLTYMSVGSKDGRTQFAIPDAAPLKAQLVTSSGSSVQSTITALAAEREDNLVWVLKAVSGNSWIKAGASPTAAAGSDWYLEEGATLPLNAAPNQKIAVISA